MKSISKTNYFFITPFVLFALSCGGSKSLQVPNDPPTSEALKEYDLTSTFYNENTIFFWREENEMSPENVVKVQESIRRYEEATEQISLIKKPIKDLESQRELALAEYDSSTLDQYFSTKDQMESAKNSKSGRQNQLEKNKKNLEECRKNSNNPDEACAKFQQGIDKAQKEIERLNQKLAELEDSLQKFIPKVFEIDKKIIEASQFANQEIISRGLDKIPDQAMGELLEQVDLFDRKIEMKIDSKHSLRFSIYWMARAACTENDCTEYSLANNLIKNFNYDRHGGVLRFDLLNSSTNDRYHFELVRLGSPEATAPHAYQGDVVWTQQSGKVRYGVAKFIYSGRSTSF